MVIDGDGNGDDLWYPTMGLAMLIGLDRRAAFAVLQYQGRFFFQNLDDLETPVLMKDITVEILSQSSDDVCLVTHDTQLTTA